MKKLEVNFMYYVLRNRVKKLEKEVEELKEIIKELTKDGKISPSDDISVLIQRIEYE